MRGFRLTSLVTARSIVLRKRFAILRKRWVLESLEVKGRGELVIETRSQGFRSPSARFTPGYHPSPFQGLMAVALRPHATRSVRRPLRRGAS